MEMIRKIISSIFVVWVIFGVSVSANWHEWWTYDGISGPSYWGVINPAWTMCNKGRQQSPVDISPGHLVYDARLSEQNIHIDKHPTSGNLLNTGQSLVFKVDIDRAANIPVNITGGPLSYRYQFEEMILHWGNEGEGGSEHSINGHFFPAEIQLYGYNAHLFTNLSEAVLHPHGAVGVTIMVQESERAGNKVLRHITSNLNKVKYRGQSHPIHGINLQEMMPNTLHFMTYEGSVTYPGCWETVTWIVLNKPIYISAQDLFGLRMLMQGDEVNPKAPLARNSRPIQPLNSRTVRTNIAFPGTSGAGAGNTFSKSDYSEVESQCPEAFREMYYQANSFTEPAVKSSP